MTPEFDTEANVYRRRITARAIDARRVRCELQDDFHHFIVHMTHDGESVSDISAESLRWPWATCPDATAPLRELIGMPLSQRFTDASRYVDASLNCTHQFDAAAHAITHAFGRRAGDRTATRRYDCEIGATLATSEQGAGQNRLWVDGELRLTWMVLAGRGPVGIGAPFVDAPWKGGFMRWADATLGADAAECAIVLRRACDIGMGRGMDLDAIPQAGELLGIMSGVCYTMQPTIAIGSKRNVGNIHDFSSTPWLLDETFGEGSETF